MKSKRLWLLLVAAAGVIFVGVEVARHLREQALHDPRASLEFTPGAALQVKNFRRSRIEDGRKAWEVKGVEATYFKSEEMALITRPALVFYHEDGRILEATGRRGHVFLPDGELLRAELDGAVDIIYQGVRFHAEKLIYFHAENRVVCPGRVAANVDGVDLEGENMTYSLTDDTIELQSGVRTTIHTGRLGHAEVVRRLTRGKDAGR